MSDECRFDRDDDLQKDEHCITHSDLEHVQWPALCTHATAQLEATLAAEKRNHEDDHKAATALQEKVAYLEGQVKDDGATIAHLATRVRELEGQVRWLESQERNYESCNTDLWDRLTRAEATVESWRAEATRLAVKVEDLEHTVGTLKEKLRRIWGYINSVVPQGDVDKESK